VKRLLLVAFAQAAVFAARPAMSADLEPAPVYQPPPPVVTGLQLDGMLLGRQRWDRMVDLDLFKSNRQSNPPW
jgi:hypothetical protein